MVEAPDVRWTRCLHPCLKQIHKCGLLPNVETPLMYKKQLILMGSQSSQSAYAHLDQIITHTRGLIAYGRLKGTKFLEVGFYVIVLDEIVDGSVDLFDGERKLGDIILGDVLDWPIIRTILY